MDQTKITDDVVRRAGRNLSWPGIVSAAVFASGLVLQAWWPQLAGAATPLRLIALVVFTVFALRRRSLTVWIIWGMLAGVELGLDMPGVALQARVFSDIFLRLIKTIVAPLILGTLITGIAGHGEMRSVGRLGLKSLIYFGVLETIAMGSGSGAH